MTLLMASVVVFALTVALVASRSQLDILGFIFVACLTALGGGTLCDVLLNRPESPKAGLRQAKALVRRRDDTYPWGHVAPQNHSR